MLQSQATGQTIICLCCASCKIASYCGRKHWKLTWMNECMCHKLFCPSLRYWRMTKNRRKSDRNAIKININMYECYKATPLKKAWLVCNAVFVAYQTILASIVLAIRLKSFNQALTFLWILSSMKSKRRLWSFHMPERMLTAIRHCRCIRCMRRPRLDSNSQLYVYHAFFALRKKPSNAMLHCWILF